MDPSGQYPDAVMSEASRFAFESRQITVSVVDPSGEGSAPSEPNERLRELYGSSDENLGPTPNEFTSDNPPQTGSQGSTQTTHYELAEHHVSSNKEK